MFEDQHQLTWMLKETPLPKLLEIVYDNFKNHGNALHWVNKVKTTEEEYVMPATYQEFVGDLRGKLGADLEDVCRQINEKINEEIRKTGKPHNEMTVSKLSMILDCVNHMDSKDLENKQNLPSSSSSDKDQTKIPNEDMTNDEPISELVQHWINNIKSTDESHDNQTKVGTEKKKIDWAEYIREPLNRYQDFIDKKNNEVPVASVPKNHHSARLLPSQRLSEPTTSSKSADSIQASVSKLRKLSQNKEEVDRKVSKLPKCLKSNGNKEKVLKEDSKPDDPIQHPSHKNAIAKVQTKKKVHSKLTKPFHSESLELKKLLKDIGYDDSYQRYQKRKEKEVEELKALKLEIQKKDEKIEELEKMMKDSSHLAAENSELREEIRKKDSYILDLEWERDQHIFIREQQKLKDDRLEMHSEDQKTSDESLAKDAKIDDLEKRLKEKERENEELKASIRNMIVSDREAFKMVDNHYKLKMEEEKKMNSGRIDELTAQMEKLTKCVEKLMK
ncbi:hypothetical protein GCK72_015257 [Caenorhabditis remanei]|uniref:Uncharacterized protein n=1 Tax=Caenorhabditis remanei TaxID=31234 RepID=A0A6A5GUC9_CAERE|nr:hypothetical protein GCK72_015257 [Caenorhabditis remanei]KAF1758797.1 hypothetical protein GCK72_015257 [Caenorhabditis remanei]